MNRFLSKLVTFVVGASAVAALTVRDCLAAPIVYAAPARAAAALPPVIDPTDPPNLRPRIISVTAAPPGGPAPLSVQFSADAYDPDGEIVDYYWTFGDGQSASGPSPAHVYQAAGAYTARLTVTDDGGLSASRSVAIQVTGSGQNVPPQVSAAASPTSGIAPLNVQFSASAFDPDGQIVAYSWNFGDGQTAFEANPAHTYYAPGNYSATVTVTDNGGLSASAAVAVQVSPAPSQGADFVFNTDPLVLYSNLPFYRASGTVTATARNTNSYPLSYVLSTYSTVFGYNAFYPLNMYVSSAGLNTGGFAFVSFRVEDIGSNFDPPSIEYGDIFCTFVNIATGDLVSKNASVILYAD